MPMFKVYSFLLMFSSSLFSLAQCDSGPIFANDSSHAVCFEESATVRYCITNNIPDHDYGPFGGGNTLEGQDFEYAMCLYPELGTSITPLTEDPNSTGCGGGIVFGISDQGVNYSPFARLYWVNPNTQEENKDFIIEADFTLNMDGNGGHVNSISRYHYHNIPTNYFTNDLQIDGNSHSPIVGYAADGFPIYYKYIYTNALDINSGITDYESGYQLKSGQRPGDGISAPNGSYDGTYVQDYEYITSELDECGGRFGITPEHPNGTYYYVLTDNWPFIPRCLKGNVVDNSFKIGPNCPTSTAETDCNTNLSTEVYMPETDVLVYFNTNKKHVVIELTQKQKQALTGLSLYSQDAKLMFSTKQSVERLDVASLNQGIYFIQFRFGQDQVTQKISLN